VSDVVVGAPFGEPGLHRQHLLGPIEGLDLALASIDKHDRVLRRREIQTHHVDDLGDQLRVGGELERLRPPRLDAVVPPGPVTVAFPIPRWSASSREDQCVTPSFFGGGGFNVAATIAR
jgi:hypothetical protein